MGKNRRFSRFRPDDARVWLSLPSGRRLAAIARDESYGGLGVRCPANPELLRGAQVTIEIDEQEFLAEVVAIESASEEDVHVGLRWLTEDEASD